MGIKACGSINLGGSADFTSLGKESLPEQMLFKTVEQSIQKRVELLTWALLRCAGGNG
jgi:hypothetical protein